MVLGGLWLCLWRTRTRALGLVVAALGLALAPASQRPDVLIDRNGQTAALRSDSGNLVFPPATAAGYSVDNWLLADGDERGAKAAVDESAFSCGLLGCIGTVKGKKVALPPSGGARGRLPVGRHRHRTFHHRQVMPRRARDRRPAHAAG